MGRLILIEATTTLCKNNGTIKAMRGGRKRQAWGLDEDRKIAGGGIAINDLNFFRGDCSNRLR